MIRLGIYGIYKITKYYHHCHHRQVFGLTQAFVARNGSQFMWYYIWVNFIPWNQSWSPLQRSCSRISGGSLAKWKMMIHRKHRPTLLYPYAWPPHISNRSWFYANPGMIYEPMTRIPNMRTSCIFWANFILKCSCLFMTFKTRDLALILWVFILFTSPQPISTIELPNLIWK